MQPLRRFLQSTFDKNMLIPTTFTISDDSGFLAIVNADRYNSFFANQWELPQLLNHFVDEMNNDNLIIWATGSENNWTVNFIDKSFDKNAFREFSKTIEVTNGQLFLTNYEDLTMAAQFEYEQIPSKQNDLLNIKLDNGKYNFTIRQLFNPVDHEYEVQGKVSFEIVLQPFSKGQTQKIDKIFWQT
jgi:hypothetical protein